MKIVRKIFVNVRDRNEAMAFCLAKLSSLDFDTLLQGTLSGEEAFEVGLIASNLERESFAKSEMIIGLNTCNPESEVELYYNFSLFLFEIQQYYYCGICLHKCVELLNDNPTIKPDRKEEILGLLHLCKTETDMEGQVSQQFCMIKRPKMFADYAVFENQITIIQGLLRTPVNMDLASNLFSVKTVKHWRQFNALLPIALSCIATKGFGDFEKALNVIFDFILSMPPTILVKKIAGLKILPEILERCRDQFQEPYYRNSTVEEFIDNAEMFVKDKSYFKYLSVFTKILLIMCTQSSHNALPDQNVQILYDLGKSLTVLTQISKLLLYNSKTTTLDKKHAEKNSKILAAYRKEVNDLEILVAKSSTKICLLYSYAFKKFNFETNLTRQNVQYIRNNNTQVCQRTISVSTGLSIYFKRLKLQSWEKESDLSRIYLLEVLLFQDLREIQELKCKGACQSNSQRNCNGIRAFFFKEEIIKQLSKLLFKALILNHTDNPSNIRIVDHLMYCVILHGNFHISVIWFLKAIKEIMVLRSGISLISHDDGDEPITTLFCQTFQNYQIHLDYNIDKICDSQTTLEFKIFQEKHEQILLEQMYIPTYLANKRLDFEVISKKGSTLLLPKTFLLNRTIMKHLPYVMGHSDSIRYLEFAFAEEMCMTERSTIVKQQLPHRQYLKGILSISKESILNSLKTSQKFIRMFFKQKNGQCIFPLLRNKVVYEQLVHFHQTATETKQDMATKVKNDESPKIPTKVRDGTIWCHSSHDSTCWKAARKAVDALERSQQGDEDRSLKANAELSSSKQQFAFVDRADCC